jgi:hypothetical protein
MKQDGYLESGRPVPRVTPTGLELPATTADEDSKLGNPPPASAAQSGAVLADPNLARLIDAWPTLPEPICRAILALVETALLGVHLPMFK